MSDGPTTLTLAARTPEPYVHVDNRALVICSAGRCAR